MEDKNHPAERIGDRIGFLISRLPVSVQTVLTWIEDYTWTIASEGLEAGPLHITGVILRPAQWQKWDDMESARVTLTGKRGINLVRELGDDYCEDDWNGDTYLYEKGWETLLQLSLFPHGKRHTTVTFIIDLYSRPGVRDEKNRAIPKTASLDPNASTDDTQQ